MSQYVTGNGVLTIPADKQEAARDALIAKMAEQRKDWTDWAGNPKGDGLDDALSAALIFSESSEFNIVGDYVGFYYYGKSLSGMPVDEDDYLEVLAPFVTSGYITWENEEGDRWITRYWEGGVGNYDAVEIYPRSPCPEDNDGS